MSCHPLSHNLVTIIHAPGMLDRAGEVGRAIVAHGYRVERHPLGTLRSLDGGSEPHTHKAERAERLTDLARFAGVLVLLADDHRQWNDTGLVADFELLVGVAIGSKVPVLYHDRWGVGGAWGHYHGLVWPSADVFDARTAEVMASAIGMMVEGREHWDNLVAMRSLYRHQAIGVLQQMSARLREAGRDRTRDVIPDGLVKEAIAIPTRTCTTCRETIPAGGGYVWVGGNPYCNAHAKEAFAQPGVNTWRRDTMPIEPAAIAPKPLSGIVTEALDYTKAEDADTKPAEGDRQPYQSRNPVEGKTECGGDCCACFSLPFTLDEARAKLAGENVPGIPNDPQIAQIVDMLIPLGAYDQLPLPLRRLVVFEEDFFKAHPEKRARETFFTCKHFDAVAGRCMNYENRPNMCRSFPNSYTGCPYPTCSSGCSKAAKAAEAMGTIAKEAQALGEKAAGAIADEVKALAGKVLPALRNANDCDAETCGPEGCGVRQDASKDTEAALHKPIHVPAIAPNPIGWENVRGMSGAAIDVERCPACRHGVLLGQIIAHRTCCPACDEPFTQNRFQRVPDGFGLFPCEACEGVVVAIDGDPGIENVLADKRCWPCRRMSKASPATEARIQAIAAQPTYEDAVHKRSATDVKVMRCMLCKKGAIASQVVAHNACCPACDMPFVPDEPANGVLPNHLTQCSRCPGVVVTLAREGEYGVRREDVAHPPLCWPCRRAADGPIPDTRGDRTKAVW